MLGFAKITRDLTDRKMAEETLKQSEQQFRLLVQGVTDYALYMLDPEGLVSSWNAGAERIKLYREDEVVGQHFSRFYSEEDRQAGQPELALRVATTSVASAGMLAAISASAPRQRFCSPPCL